MNSISIEVKEEPFEEFFVPETVLNIATIKNDSECCMCPEGLKIQNFLIEHLNEHSEKAFHDSAVSLSCCECPQGIAIQTELINHLLSHFSVKQELDSLDRTYTESIAESLEDQASKEVTTIDKSRKSERRNESENYFRDEETKRFSCRFCEKSFLYKQGVLKHIAIEHKSDNYRPHKVADDGLKTAKVKCSFCTKVFKYKQGVKKHWELEHNPKNLFPCPRPHCPSRCKTLKNLHAHIRTHDPPREESLDSLQCFKCLKRFQSQKQLFLHSYTHREKFFCCDKCGLKFNNKEQVKNHILRHVGLFQKKVYYQRIVCDQCSMMVFTHKMKRHKLVHHSDEKPFKCDFSDCNATFSDSRILSDHQNIHLNLKPYKCEFCSEAFRSGANLRLHRVRHTDPNRHRCHECQTSFVTKQALQKHLRRHTEDPEIRPFACDYPGCNSTFKQKDHVRNHMRSSEHSLEFEALQIVRHTDPNRHRCHECQTSFVTKQALQKHLRRHTEDPEIRPFACDYPGCNSTFKQKDHVRNHIRRTHEKTDEIFNCQHCSKSYDRKDALGKHLRKSHNITKRKSRVFPIDFQPEKTC